MTIDASARWQHYLKEFHSDYGGTNSGNPRPLYIDFLQLADFDPLLASHLLQTPIKYGQTRGPVRSDSVSVINPDLDSATAVPITCDFPVRFRHFPHSIPSIGLPGMPRSAHCGRLVSITGTVTRTGLLKMIEREKLVRCSKCGYTESIRYDVGLGEFPRPTYCPEGRGCGPKSFEDLQVPLAYRDIQEIRVQEQVDKLSLGNIPRSITVILLDDLVDCCKAGDRITIVGVVKPSWRAPAINDKFLADLIIDASAVECHEAIADNSRIDDQLRLEFETYWAEFADRPLTGRDNIVAGFCGNIYGMYVIKLAMLMILMGGVARTENDIKVRGESHILLVGDPGTGKSQFLKAAFELFPSRSVLTTGVGSTTAGLTCSAIKDSGEWQLEAGALVLADGGVCCIDEFGSIREHDKTAIHEAMEQQTLSVAKAGLVCKLNTRCSVIAAMNPKGTYDPQQSVEVNLGLASPLLSRFDLIFVLMDRRNERWDKTVSSFLLNKEINHQSQQKQQRGLNSDGRSSWNDTDRLRRYISHCKRLEPALSPDSRRVLGSYYQLQRKTDLRNSARTTIRLLESLIRLAQAHARLMMRDQVTVQDSIMAVVIVEQSLMGIGIYWSAMENGGALHAAFHSDPDENYREMAPRILQKLELPDIPIV